MQDNWKVEIQNSGKSGNIFYEEGSQCFDFYWEFGGAPGIVLIIWSPEPSDWDEKIPWASGRRDEILNRVAQEVIRQRAPNCVPDIHTRSGVFYIREKNLLH
jgi:hypothetical protein